MFHFLRVVIVFVRVCPFAVAFECCVCDLRWWWCVGVCGGVFGVCTCAEFVFGWLELVCLCCCDVVVCVVVWFVVVICCV